MSHRHLFVFVVSGPAPCSPGTITTIRRCHCGRWEYQELAMIAGLDVGMADQLWNGLIPKLAPARPIM